MLILIDNYDSFTYNLAQYFGELGRAVTVLRNDQTSIAAVADLRPEHLVISPGPCTPNEAGISVEVMKKFAGQVPVLGVCLGHQCLGQAFGAKVVRARQLMHGKTSLVHHRGESIFRGLPSPFRVARYHSLSLERASLPEDFAITAWSDDDEIMAVLHRATGAVGVQFHPESIASEHGHKLLQNFLENRAS